MTPPLAPGQRLLADSPPLVTGSPLAAADAVATALSKEIAGLVSPRSAITEAPTLIAADLEVKQSLSDSSLTPTGVVTAVLTGHGTSVRTEATAFLSDDRGVSAVLRVAFDAEAESVSGLLCPGSGEWNADLHRRLSRDESFARLIKTYDGTIGLSIGGRPVHIRCYRGQVLEVVARAVKGADFVLDITGEVFIDLMTSSDNSFMEAAMLGRMRSSGSGYEYLRMTSALIRIIDNARALAGAAEYIGAPTNSIETLQVA